MTDNNNSDPKLLKKQKNNYSIEENGSNFDNSTTSKQIHKNNIKLSMNTSAVESVQFQENVNKNYKQKLKLYHHITNKSMAESSQAKFVVGRSKGDSHAIRASAQSIDIRPKSNSFFQSYKNEPNSSAGKPISDLITDAELNYDSDLLIQLKDNINTDRDLNTKYHVVVRKLIEDLKTKQILFDKIFNSNTKDRSKFISFKDLSIENLDKLRSTLKSNYEKFVEKALDPQVIKTLEKLNPKGETKVIKQESRFDIEEEIMEVERLSLTENLNISAKNQINDQISFKQVIKVILFSKYKQIIRELVRIIEDVTYMIFEYKFLLEKVNMSQSLTEQNTQIKQKIADMENNISSMQKSKVSNKQFDNQSPEKLDKKCKTLSNSINSVQSDIIRQKKELENKLTQNERLRAQIIEYEQAQIRDAKEVDKLKNEIETVKKDISKSEEIKKLIQQNFSNSQFFEQEFNVKREAYVSELRGQMRELESLKNTNIEMDRKVKENSVQTRATQRKIAELEFNTNKLMKVHSKQLSKLHDLEKQKADLEKKLREDTEENDLNEQRIPELEKQIQEFNEKESLLQAQKEQHLKDIEQEKTYQEELKLKKAQLNEQNSRIRSAYQNEMQHNGALDRKLSEKEKEIKKLSKDVSTLEEKHADYSNYIGYLNFYESLFNTKLTDAKLKQILSGVKNNACIVSYKDKQQIGSYIKFTKFRYGHSEYSFERETLTFNDILSTLTGKYKWCKRIAKDILSNQLTYSVKDGHKVISRRQLLNVLGQYEKQHEFTRIEDFREKEEEQLADLYKFLQQMWFSLVDFCKQFYDVKEFIPFRVLKEAISRRNVYMSPDEYQQFRLLNQEKNISNEINDLDVIFLYNQDDLHKKFIQDGVFAKSINLEKYLKQQVPLEEVKEKCQNTKHIRQIMEASKPSLKSLDDIKLDEIQKNEVQYIALFEELDIQQRKYLTLSDCEKFLDGQLKKFQGCTDKNLAFVKKFAHEFVDQDKTGRMELDKFKYLIYFIVTYQEMWDTFQKIDKNKDGKLDIKEFMQQVKDYNIKVKNPFREYHKMDQEQDGAVKFVDFSRFYIIQKICIEFESQQDEGLVKYLKTLKQNLEEETEQSWQVIDTSKRGRIKKAEFSNWFKCKVTCFKNDKLVNLMKKNFDIVDSDNSGQIDREEFTAFQYQIQTQFDAYYQFLWMDDDRSGEISITEFKKHFKRLQLPPSINGSGDQQTAFKMFDKSNSGKVFVFHQAQVQSEEWKKQDMENLHIQLKEKKSKQQVDFEFEDDEEEEEEDM